MRVGITVRFLLLTLACAVVLAFWSQPTSAEDAGRPNANPLVRVGVVGSLFRDTPAPLVAVLMRPFKRLLDDQTGINGLMVAGSDAEALADQLADDKVQLGVFHGFEFAWAKLKYPELKPLIVAVSPLPCAKAHLVIGKASPATKLEDLKGKVLAVPLRLREHCHLFLDRRCLEAGNAPDKFFEKIIKSESSDDALDDLVDGKVDAAIVDGESLRHYTERKTGRAAKLKPLLISEMFPSAVVACNPANFDKESQKRFHDGLINATQTEKGKRLLTMCRITGFESIPTDFDKKLAEIAKAYPPPSAKKFIMGVQASSP